LNRCSDDLDPLAAEDLVEGAAELRVAIVDQEAWRRGSVGEGPRQLAGLLRDPGVAWMLGAARDVDPAATQLDEEEDVEPCREDGVDGEEVAREHARGLAADELAPGDAGSLASGSEPCFAQELADRRRRDAESERPELARDPLVAPATVLARESEDQLADLTADRRSPGARRWIGPAPRHEVAMPAHERLGRDEERTPALAREQPARCGQERAVAGPKPGRATWRRRTASS
jgi:hypothetical protein